MIRTHFACTKVNSLKTVYFQILSLSLDRIAYCNNSLNIILLVQAK